jgi:hypothetical protein
MRPELIISTTNRQMADALLSLKIPEAKQTEVKKYAVELEQVFYVAVQFASSVGATMLARWLYDAITKPESEKTKIEGRPIPQNVVHIEKLIINYIQRSERDKTADKETDEN